jgi:hypothetical protein
MRSTTFLALASAALVSTASARINGFFLPSTIYPDTETYITITTEGYIQSVDDVSISFGISPAASAYPQTLGAELLSSKFLGPGTSSASSSFKIPSPILYLFCDLWRNLILMCE